jgi:hypothetical protein
MPGKKFGGFGWFDEWLLQPPIRQINRFLNLPMTFSKSKFLRHAVMWD